MSRIKERRKFIHEPSTQEIFICLQTMVSWSKILYEHGQEKEYKPFLEKLLELNYFKENEEEKLTIKRISTELKVQTTKATKWLHNIYDDILELNLDKPQLFINNKITAQFFCRYFDSSASIHLGIDIMPREYENFSFSFIKAKVGTDNFWVSRVDYEVYENCVQPIIWLEGGILNRYREMAVEEGLFKGWLHFTDRWNKSSHEIDEILLERFRR